jgi:hypothetical protein
VDVETKDSSVVPAETVTRYRVTMVILVAMVAVLLLVILILTLK